MSSTSQFEGTVLMAGKAWQWECGVAGCIASTDRKQRISRKGPGYKTSRPTSSDPLPSVGLHFVKES